MSHAQPCCQHIAARTWFFRPGTSSDTPCSCSSRAIVSCSSSTSASMLSCALAYCCSRSALEARRDDRSWAAASKASRSCVGRSSHRSGSGSGSAVVVAVSALYNSLRFQCRHGLSPTHPPTDQTNPSDAHISTHPTANTHLIHCRLHLCPDSPLQLSSRAQHLNLLLRALQLLLQLRHLL